MKKVKQDRKGKKTLAKNERKTVGTKWNYSELNVEDAIRNMQELISRMERTQPSEGFIVMDPHLHRGIQEIYGENIEPPQEVNRHTIPDHIRFTVPQNSAIPNITDPTRNVNITSPMLRAEDIVAAQPMTAGNFSGSFSMNELSFIDDPEL